MNTVTVIDLKRAMEKEEELEEIYAVLGKDFILALIENTKRARAKHPVFATYEEEKFKILQEEFEEVREAFYVPQDVASHAPTQRTKEELLDVATVLVRWYGNE